MRWARFFAAALFLAAAFAPPLQAQEEKECECQMPWGQIFLRGSEDWPQVSWVGRRARLGVFVNTRAKAETDRYGALIEGVTKGGPADKAGIQKGDIITKLGGVSLLSGSETYEEDVSVPGMRLIERARELESGDTVKIEFRRDGATQTVELVAGGFGDAGVIEWSDFADEFERSGRLHGLMERLHELPEIHVEGPETFALRLGARLPGLQLVSLNEDLGAYFGTDEGVLVVSVPEDSDLNLEAGDVIDAIDGRTVRSPSHAMRILRSYDADEEVSFRIMRNKKQRDVKGKVPEGLGGPRLLRIEREKG